MDWDSSATVKSCSNHTTPKQTTRIEAASSSNKGFGYLDALNLDDEDDTFFGFLDHINDQNNGLQELENISSLPCNGDGSHVVDSSRANSRPIQQQVVQNYYQPQPLQPQPPATTVSLRQSQLPFHYQWQQWHQGQGSSNVCPVETTQASPSRARNNKKGEKKVFQVAAEYLCSDAWQWRKYGQKPIKGSHFPRNYYRCSSSKACTARKQVERSHVDSKMFKVTYSGEHTAFCPPPNQFPPAGNAPVSQNVANNEPPEAAINGGEIEALSPVEAEAGDDVVETGGGGVSAGDGGGIEGDAEDLLIPNFNVLNDDLLKGFQQLGGTIGGGE